MYNSIDVRQLDKKQQYNNWEKEYIFFHKEKSTFEQQDRTRDLPFRKSPL